jgi:hypothetical protein
MPFSAMKNAIYAIIAAVAGMLLYIAFAFRKMPSPFHYRRLRGSRADF